jgi:hypothetical protein
MIEPASDGPGTGARMRVLLPLVAKEKTVPLRKPEPQLAAA